MAKYYGVTSITITKAAIVLDDGTQIPIKIEPQTVAIETLDKYAGAIAYELRSIDWTIIIKRVDPFILALPTNNPYVS